MNLKSFTLLILIFVSCSTISVAQDFHYTQYFFSPLAVNPATAGGFSGSYRINGIYRDQYRGSATEAFGGFGINIDVPVIRGIRKQDWVGVGLRMDQATAGSVGQKMNIFGLGAAYHLAFNKSQSQFLSIGVQYGTGGYSYDRSKIEESSFATGIIQSISLSEQATNFQSGGSAGGGGGQGENSTRFDGGSLSDLSVGVVYNSRNAKNGTDFKLGVSVEGILNPDRGTPFIRGGEDGRGIGIQAFTTYDFELSEKASLSSGAYYYTAKKASALVVSSIANYKIKPGNDLILHGGLGMRNVRAALVYLGATIRGIRVGLAYDFDLGSSVVATNNHKSIELGVTYLGKIYKKPKPKPIIYCPRL